MNAVSNIQPVKCQTDTECFRWSKRELKTYTSFQRKVLRCIEDATKLHTRTKQLQYRDTQKTETDPMYGDAHTYTVNQKFTDVIDVGYDALIQTMKKFIPFPNLEQHEQEEVFYLTNQRKPYVALQLLEYLPEVLVDIIEDYSADDLDKIRVHVNDVFPKMDLLTEVKIGMILANQGPPLVKNTYDERGVLTKSEPLPKKN